MVCSRVERLLEAYFDGALPGRQAEMVAAHLQQCPACARELAQIAKIAASLAAVPRSEPGVDLMGRISAQLADLPAPAARRRWLAGWRRLELVAGTCVAFVAAWRYALPLLLSREAARLPLLGAIKPPLARFMSWLATVPDALYTLSPSLRGLPEALGLAASKVAPIVGLYAAAEVGIIAAIIIIGHRAHRARPASLTSLV